MIYTHVFRFRNLFSLADRRRSRNISSEIPFQFRRILLPSGTNLFKNSERITRNFAIPYSATNYS